MLLQFSVTVAEWPTVWKRAALSVYSACLSRTFVNFYVHASFPFDFEGGIWYSIVLLPEHCFYIYILGLHYILMWRLCDLDRFNNFSLS